MEERERFLENRDENLSLGSGFAFHSWQTPRVQEKGIACAKARRAPKIAEVIDLD